MATKQIGLTRGSVAKRVARLDFQFELFAKAALPPTMAERNQFVLSDTAVAALENGERIHLDELKNYKLVSRNRPVRIFESGDGNYGGAAYSFAESAAGLHAMTADETKLLLGGQMICSVDCSETTPFASAF